MTYPPQQPGPYGQQPPQYPQQQYPYLGPQGWPPNGKPPGNKRGLIIAVAVAAVLLAGGAVTAVLLTRGDDAPSSAAPAESTTSERPTSAKRPSPTKAAPPTAATTIADADAEQAVTAVARQYIDAVIKKDKAAATALTCGKTDAGSMYDVIANSKSTPQMGTVKIYKKDMATVDILLAGSNAQAVPYPIELHDGAWCVRY